MRSRSNCNHAAKAEPNKTAQATTEGPATGGRIVLGFAWTDDVAAIPPQGVGATALTCQNGPV